MSVGQGNAGGTRAYPVQEAFERLGIGSVKGYELINSGELETYKVGRYRYVTEQALQKFTQRRIREALQETKQQRFAKVANAVAGRQKQRKTVDA